MPAENSMINVGAKAQASANIYDRHRRRGTTSNITRLLIALIRDIPLNVNTENGIVAKFAHWLIIRDCQSEECFVCIILYLLIISAPQRTPAVAEKERQNDISLKE